LNKHLITLAATALLTVGGAAVAVNSAFAADNSGGATKSNSIDPAKTVGTPDEAKTPGVEGRSGSQSGAQPADNSAPGGASSDKMAPDSAASKK
jgi:hypothetical protein